MIKFERHNYESCRGLTVWKSSTRHVEFWYCPRGYEIKKHSHPQENIELLYLLGRTTFYRTRNGVEQSFRPRWFDIGRTFSVLAGDVHWFSVSKMLPLVFINVSKFLSGYKPVSASVDFQPVN